MPPHDKTQLALAIRLHEQPRRYDLLQGDTDVFGW